ncbi:MAG: hypothetical protein WEB88_17085 [Gemmatimonadota bacterium]
MHSRSRARSLIGAGTAALALLVTVPATAHAQNRTLSWTETSRIELPGTLGAVLGVIPGLLDERASQQSIHLREGVLIQEGDGSATIVDADNRRFISVDHEAQSYLTVSFQESADAASELARIMTAAVEGAAEGTKETLAQARAAQQDSMARFHEAMAEARAQLNFRVAAERTGSTRDFGAAGTATQHIITATLDAAAPPDGVADAEEGSLVFVMELWQSAELPTPDALYEEWGARLAEDPAVRSLADELAGSAGGVGDAGAAGLAMWDPRMAAGLVELADALQGIDGTTVRSVVTVALVPDGQELDREELLAWEPASMGDELRRGAVEAAGSAAASAARGAFGRLGFGGRGDNEEEEEAQPVRPLFRVITVKEDIVFEEGGTDALGALEQRMESYRALTLADLMNEAGIGR